MTCSQLVLRDNLCGYVYYYVGLYAQVAFAHKSQRWEKQTWFLKKETKQNVVGLLGKGYWQGYPQLRWGNTSTHQDQRPDWDVTSVEADELCALSGNEGMPFRGRMCGGRMSCWDNITPRCAGWHRGPDLEWKTGHELNLIQKSPVMPTSACVPL